MRKAVFILPIVFIITIVLLPACSKKRLPTEIIWSTNTNTATATPINSATRTKTSTLTAVITSTFTQTAVNTMTNTPVPPTLTATAVNTSMVTLTYTPEKSPTPTHTPLPATATTTLSATRSATGTFTPVETNTSTATGTVAMTATVTSTRTETRTATRTITISNTVVPSLTGTVTTTGTRTITRTFTATFTSTPNLPVYLNPLTVTASCDDGNIPANTLDDNYTTRWSCEGAGVWITYDLGDIYYLSALDIAFYSGAARQSYFDVQISFDGITWAQINAGLVSSGTTTALESFDINDVDARYLRIIGNGNSVNGWNSYTEVRVVGAVSSITGTPTYYWTPTVTYTATGTRTPTATATRTATPVTGGIVVPAGYTAIYEEDMETHAITWFDSTTNFWLFYWDRNNDSSLAMRRERFLKQSESGNNYLRLIRKNGDQDYSGLGLNPRTEVRIEGSQWRIDIGQEHVIKFSARIMTASFAAEFLQIMGKDETNASKPRFQLEVYNGNYGARYNPNTTGTTLARQALSGGSTFASTVGQWVDWEIRFRLSSNSSLGYITIYQNGLQVWTYNSFTYWANTSQGWIQHGAYGNNGSTTEMIIDFDDFLIADK